MLCRVAQSAMLGGQASRPLGTLGSAGVPSLQIRPSEASAASIQVLETILSQAHRVSFLAGFIAILASQVEYRGHHCS